MISPESNIFRFKYPINLPPMKYEFDVEFKKIDTFLEKNLYRKAGAACGYMLEYILKKIYGKLRQKARSSLLKEILKHEKKIGKNNDDYKTFSLEKIIQLFIEKKLFYQTKEILGFNCYHSKNIQFMQLIRIKNSCINSERPVSNRKDIEIFISTLKILLCEFNYEINNMEKKISILVVDDEELARDRINRLLLGNEKYYICAEAENGAEALIKTEKYSPDIILIDISMPVMNGIEVAKILSEKETPPAIIFTTAYDEYALEAFSTKSSGYLMKPIRQEQLIQTLTHSHSLNKAQQHNILSLTTKNPKPLKSHLKTTDSFIDTHNNTFDTFVFYNQQDKQQVKELINILKKKNISIWLDDEQSRPGISQTKPKEKGIYKSKSVIILVGEKGAPWEDRETEALLQFAFNKKIPLIPVLLPNGISPSRKPFFMHNTTGVDFQLGYTEEGINQLTWGILGKKEKIIPMVVSEQINYLNTKIITLRQKVKLIANHHANSLINNLQEALDIANINKEDALFKLRKILEQVCKYIYSHTGGNPKGKMLAWLMQKISERGVIPSNIFKHMSTIRSFGNAGAHPSGGNYNIQDFEAVFLSLITVVDWYISPESVKYFRYSTNKHLK